MNNFIPIAAPIIEENEARAVYDVVKSGWISMGKKVEEFEKLACEYTGAKHAIAMNNGTSTLHSLLISLGIGPGDEVIVPSMTYISSVNVVLYVGATPVLCDSNPETFNVDVSHIEEKITNKTKAFMTVDMKGQPVDFEKLNQLSEEKGIPFISDSAESYGSIYKGEKVGNQALAHSFSFFANKNITTGEGGMVTTNDDKLAKNLKIIRNQGQEGRYNHTWLGNNYRMTDIQAAIGIEQFKRIDFILDKKVEIANYYNQAFNSFQNLDEPFVPDFIDRPSWYMYCIKMESNKRNKLMDLFKIEKIDYRLSFPPVHTQPYYVNKFGYKDGDFPNAYESYNTFLDIPIFAQMNKNTQNRIISTITSIFNK